MRTDDESAVWQKAYDQAIRKGYDPAGWAQFSADMAVERFVAKQRKRQTAKPDASLPPEAQ